MPYIKFNKDNNKDDKSKAIIFNFHTHTHIHAYWQATCSWFSRLNSWWPKPLTQTHSNPKNNNDNDQSKLKGFTLQTYAQTHFHRLCDFKLFILFYTQRKFLHSYAESTSTWLSNKNQYQVKVTDKICWVNILRPVYFSCLPEQVIQPLRQRENEKGEWMRESKRENKRTLSLWPQVKHFPDVR